MIGVGSARGRQGRRGGGHTGHLVHAVMIRSRVGKTASCGDGCCHVGAAGVVDPKFE